MPPAAIYARISRDRAGAGLGVDRQEADCQALAKRLGLPVGRVYVDNDLSAYSGKRREQYERLLEDVALGKVGALLAWHPDRLHRSPRELERFIDVVEAAGIQVHTVTAGDVDLSTASGRMTARIVGAVARHESEHKSERIRRKHLELAEKGLPNGGLRRFGYEPDNMTPRESEAELVREMCRRIVSGDSVNSISNDLIRRGIPTVKDRAWTASLVRQVVLRPRNAGLRLRKGEVIGKAAWPAIVPEELWASACAIIKDPARRTIMTNVRRHLLVGISSCGTCGAKSKVKGYKSSGQSVYCCPAGHFARRVDFVDMFVTGRVIARLSTTEQLIREPDQPRHDYAAETAALRARMKDAGRLFSRGVIDGGMLEEIGADIDVQLEALAAQTVAALPGPAAALIGSPGEVRERWDALSLTQKRAVIAELYVITFWPVKKKGRGFDPSSVQLVAR